MARILIVDDSFVARMSLSNIMTSLGHTVVGEAVDGKQAYEQYASLKPDIVTMDLTMNGCDGVQATAEILADFPDARIIVISARQENRIIIDALEHGARHLILKPASADKVALVVNNVLQQTFDRQKQAELIRRLKQAYESENVSKDNKYRSARILIVDDSATARRILREIITDLGHEVIGEAANGTQAFVEYIDLRPDLVTMDLTMEGLGGAEAISRIMAIDANARIVVISSLEVRQGIIDALERGARHFIVKPICKEKVAAVLNNVLHQEFNLQKHIECVRRLKEDKRSGGLLEQDTKGIVPPYAISVLDNNLIHIFIDQSLTLTSCQTLFLELEEHLHDEPRVLLDFGTMSALDQELLANFSQLIENIERYSGTVKAVSNNKRFVDKIALTQLEHGTNWLADILRFWER